MLCLVFCLIVVVGATATDSEENDLRRQVSVDAELSVPKCTVNLYCISLVKMCGISKQMQYRFAVNFGTLSIWWYIDQNYQGGLLNDSKEVTCVTGFVQTQWFVEGEGCECE